MTPRQRLQVRQAEARARLGAISAIEGDGYTPEIKSEEGELIGEMRSLDQRLLAADLASDGTEPVVVATSAAADDPARLELRSRCMASNFVVSAVKGRSVVGAEAELAAELNLDAGQIPLELWERPAEMRAKTDTPEHRAITGLPANTGVNLDSIRPAVFAPSVIPMLGVEMPRVPTGTYATSTINASLTAAAKAKSAAIDATAATFTTATASPKRISARLELAIEDIAAVGQSNYESALRENLSLALSSELDNQGLNGNGTAPNLAGLFMRLTDPTATPSGVADFDDFVAAFAGGVDGLWATSGSQVSLVVGVDTYRLAMQTFRDIATADAGDKAFSDYAGQHYGGFMTNSRMPAASSNVQQSILYRLGRSMMGGSMGMRTAVCPVWADSIGIDDVYSGSAKGERYVTFHVLLGDILIVQADAYAQVQFQVST